MTESCSHNWLSWTDAELKISELKWRNTFLFSFKQTVAALVTVFEWNSFFYRERSNTFYAPFGAKRTTVLISNLPTRIDFNVAISPRAAHWYGGAVMAQCWPFSCALALSRHVAAASGSYATVAPQVTWPLSSDGNRMSILLCELFFFLLNPANVDIDVQCSIVAAFWCKALPLMSRPGGSTRVARVLWAAVGLSLSLYCSAAVT